MAQSLSVVAYLLTGGRTPWKTLDWGQIHYSHIAPLRQELADRYAPASANKILCAIPGVLQEAFRLGLLSGEVYQRIADVPGIRAEVLLRGRALTRGKLTAHADIAATERYDRREERAKRRAAGSSRCRMFHRDRVVCRSVKIGSYTSRSQRIPPAQFRYMPSWFCASEARAAKKLLMTQRRERMADSCGSLLQID